MALLFALSPSSSLNKSVCLIKNVLQAIVERFLLSPTPVLSKRAFLKAGVIAVPRSNIVRSTRLSQDDFGLLSGDNPRDIGE